MKNTRDRRRKMQRPRKMRYGLLDDHAAAVFALNVEGVVFELTQRYLGQAHVAAAALVAVEAGDRRHAVLLDLSRDRENRTARSMG